MKNIENKKLIPIRLAILVLCNLIIGITLYFSYQIDNIFSWFIYLIFGVIVLIQFFHMLKNRDLYSIIVSFCSTLPLFIIYGYFECKINKESFLNANNHGVYIDLKIDSTYIIKSGSWGSKKHYYGLYKYDIKDSIIILDKNINDGTIKSRLMKVSKFKNYITKDNEYHQFLIQIDSNKKEIKNSDNPVWEFYRFEIN